MTRIALLALLVAAPAMAQDKTEPPKAAESKPAKTAKASKKMAKKDEVPEVPYELPVMPKPGSPLDTVDTLDPANLMDQGQVLRFFRQARARERAANRKSLEADRRIERLGKMTADLESRYAALRVVQEELSASMEKEQARVAAEKKRAQEEADNQKKVAEGPEHEANIERLASVFNKMKPAKAGKVVARMDKSLVVEVLMRLKDRQAAKILAEVEPSVAARLSQMMAARKARQTN
ncbi:MAG: MotE family protein [Bradymonadia bacterium]